MNPQRRLPIYLKMFCSLTNDTLFIKGANSLKDVQTGLGLQDKYASKLFIHLRNYVKQVELSSKVTPPLIKILHLFESHGVLILD